MRSSLLLLGLTCSAVQAQTSHDLVATDFQFTPDVLTIAAGDTVKLLLNAGHSFREVTQDAWELNVTTPIIGYDIGPFTENNSEHYIVLTTAPDTLYYICVPHADMGMKGRIIITEAAIGMAERAQPASLLFPNPTEGSVWLVPAIAGAVSARITDMAGHTAEVQVAPNGRIDLGPRADGIYHLTVLDANGFTLAQRSLAVQR